MAKKSLNKCAFIGRLGRDPEQRSMPDGTAITTFSIAVSDEYKDKASGESRDMTEWVNFVAIGKLAEICGQYLRKGKEIYADGRMHTRKWTDKDGAERRTTEIKLENMQMLGGREDSDAAAPSSRPASAPSSGYRNKPGHQPSPAAHRPQTDFDDDIPFMNPYFGKISLSI